MNRTSVIILAVLVFLSLMRVSYCDTSFFASVTGKFRQDGDNKWRCYVNTTLTNDQPMVITVKWICIAASVTYIDYTSDDLGIIENRTLNVLLGSGWDSSISWVVTEFGFDKQPRELRLTLTASTDIGMRYGQFFIEAPLLYEIVAPYGSTPTIDGTIDAHEWSNAASVSSNNTEVFVKQDGINLYIGFNNSDDQFHDEDVVAVLIDVDHDGSLTLQADDIGLGVYRNGTIGEANVTGGTWTTKEAVSGWTAVVNSTSDMWQAEFSITYSKISVTAGVEKTIGAIFVCYRGQEDTSPEVFSWPPGYIDLYQNPSTWGAITSAGYNWIPEFPSFLILPLFMAATLLAVTVYRRKRISQTKVLDGD